MPVNAVAAWQVAPGRRAEMMTAMSRAKAIHERLGATAQAVAVTYAGVNSGRISYRLWFPDMAAFAKYDDALGGDADWQKFAQEVLLAANPVATLVANSIGVDFPGETAPVPVVVPGSVLQLSTFQPQPGRLADIAANIAAWRAIVARHGLSSRTVQSTAAGPSAGIISVGITHASMTALVKANEALQADAAYQALIQRISGAGTPSVQIGQALGRFLPI